MPVNNKLITFTCADRLICICASKFKLGFLQKSGTCVCRSVCIHIFILLTINGTSAFIWLTNYVLARKDEYWVHIGNAKNVELRNLWWNSSVFLQYFDMQYIFCFCFANDLSIEFCKMVILIITFLTEFHWFVFYIFICFVLFYS